MIYEELLDFDFGGNCRGVCALLAFRAAGSRPVIVLGELESNRGTSVTNAIEMLIPDAIARTGLADGLVPNIVEYNHLAGTWDLVTIIDGNPHWRRISKLELEHLIGEPWKFEAHVSDSQHHTGTCRRCGRTLTNPRHAAAGIGPVCALKAVPQFDERDCSGVFDGNQVVSDADQASRRTT